MKKLYFLLIMLLVLFLNYNTVNAACYKVITQTMINSGEGYSYTNDCSDYQSYVSCEKTHDMFCDVEYPNYQNQDVKSCGYGSKKIENIPGLIPRTTNIIYTIIQIAVPVILVLLGSIDLLKGIIAQKEEDIKKGQKMFIKRLIAGAIIFFVFMLIKLFVSLVADNDNDNNTIIDCLECFIENKCD